MEGCVLCLTLIFLLSLNEDLIYGACCYSQSTTDCVYCSGYCSGTKGKEECNETSDTVSVGALMGMLGGTMVIMIICACVCVGIFNHYKAKDGGRGSVVCPDNVYNTTADESNNAGRQRTHNARNLHRTQTVSRVSIIIGPPPSYSSLDLRTASSVPPMSTQDQRC